METEKEEMINWIELIDNDTILAYLHKLIEVAYLDFRSIG